ncbi:MAG: FAD:protein FMN transferase [Chitinophagales bacterium]
MKHKTKGWLTFIATILSIFFIIACNKPKNEFIAFNGQTMGTYYAIKYVDKNANSHKKKVDELLKTFNNSVSTYIPTSIISQVNQAPADSLIQVDEYFANVFRAAKVIYEATQGHFDPTVMPLVNFWGFGYEKNKKKFENPPIDSLLQLVNFDKVVLLDSLSNEHKKIFFVKKDTNNIQLDFSAIAKGYGVDMIVELLESKGIDNYLIDIGGELRAKGNNANNKIWRVGIDKPMEDVKKRDLQQIISLHDRSIATSGNYRNFYVQNGQKYVHTINPKTGFSEISNLLSVSVLAEKCMVADAYATAFMVMGYEQARNVVLKDNKLEALFIYSDAKGVIKTDFTEEVMLIR